MKICHCVTITKEEDDALHIVLGILDELRNDDMLSCDCKKECGILPSNVHYDLENIIAFLEKWQ